MTNPRSRSLEVPINTPDPNETQTLVKLLDTLAEHALREVYRSIFSEKELKRLAVSVRYRMCRCLTIIIACIHVFLFGKSVSIDMEKFSMKELCKMAQFEEKKLNSRQQSRERREQSTIVAEIEKLGRHSCRINNGEFNEREDILKIEAEIMNTLRRLLYILPKQNEEGYILNLYLKLILREERERLPSISIDKTKSRLKKLKRKPAYLQEVFFNLLRSQGNRISLADHALRWMKKELADFIHDDCAQFPDDISRLASLEEFKDKGGHNKLIKEEDRFSVARYLRSQNYNSVPGDTVFVSVCNTIFCRVIAMLRWYIFETPSILDKSIHASIAQTLSIPIKIFSPDIEYLKKVANEFVNGKQREYKITFSLLGCTGAGKTTLLQRLSGKKIQQKSEPTKTVKIHHSIFVMQNECLKENLDGSITVTISDITTENMAPQRRRYDSKPPSSSTDCQTLVESSETENINIDIINHNSQSSSSRNEKVFHAFPASSINETFEGNYGECDIFPLLPKALIIENQHSTKITVQDFAGDANIFTCHSICLSSNGMAVVVADISKLSNDFPAHKDECKKWVESVHVNCGKNIPIILALTHADLVSPEKIDKVKEQLWTEILKWDSSLRNHLNEERVAIVGFQSEEGISKLKDCIIDLANSFSRGKKPIPLSYVIYGNFLKNLQTTRKIMNVDVFVQEMKNKMPAKLHLNPGKRLYKMLEYFHDSKQILFFNKPHTEKVIVINIQWFLDVFCKILLANSPKFTEELRQLKFSSILNRNLLQEICKDELQEKDSEHFMHYLEIIGFAVTFSRTENNWYIPSMNKNKFPVCEMKNFKPTSTICFLFDILPVDIFPRLLSSLLQKGNCIFYKANNSDCLYENAAILTERNTCSIFLIGIETTAIHVQGLFLSDSQDTAGIGYEFQINIEHKIDEIIKRYHPQKVKFSVAFKCKKTLFSDDLRTSLITSDALQKMNKHHRMVLCQHCPLQDAHLIDVREIRLPWIPDRSQKLCKDPRRKDKAENSQISHLMKPSPDHQKIFETNNKDEHLNFLHFRELTDVGITALRKEFDKRIPPQNLQKFLNANREWMTNGEFRFTKVQLGIIFPGNNCSCSSKDFDEGIMYKILRNGFKSLSLDPPNKGWNIMPSLGDTGPADDIERLHQYRNEVSHRRETNMKKDEFRTKSLDLKLAIKRIGGKEFKQQIEEIEKRYKYTRVRTKTICF